MFGIASDLLALVSVLHESVFDLRAICAGRASFLKSSLDIRSVLSDVLNIVKPIACHKGVILDIAYTQTHDFFLEADGSLYPAAYASPSWDSVQSSAAQQKVSLTVKNGSALQDVALMCPLVITIHSDVPSLPKSLYPFIYLAQESMHIQVGRCLFPPGYRGNHDSDVVSTCRTIVSLPE